MFPNTITQVGTTSLLAQLKHVIPTKLFKAIQILFKPCCQPTPVFTAVCDGGQLDVTMVVSDTVAYDPANAYLLNVFGGVVAGPAVYTGTSVTFENVTGVSPGTIDFQGLILIPTSTNGASGVFVETTVVVVTIPTC